MSNEFTLAATARDDIGKGASRRLRRLAGTIPAIVYGGKNKPSAITLVHKDLMKALENEAFYSHVVSLVIDGKAEEVILKDLQRHPARLEVLHADFFRVSKTKALTVKAPIHFINEDLCVGVKTDGGIIQHMLNELEISCLAKNLPEYIEVDMAEIELGGSVHISDIKLPKGVESVALSHGEDHDLSVASVIKPKSVAVEDEAPTETEGEEAGEEADEE